LDEGKCMRTLGQSGDCSWTWLMQCRLPSWRRQASVGLVAFLKPVGSHDTVFQTDIFVAIRGTTELTDVECRNVCSYYCEIPRQCPWSAAHSDQNVTEERAESLNWSMWFQSINIIDICELFHGLTSARMSRSTAAAVATAAETGRQSGWWSFSGFLVPTTISFTTVIQRCLPTVVFCICSSDIYYLFFDWTSKHNHGVSPNTIFQKLRFDAYYFSEIHRYDCEVDLG